MAGILSSISGQFSKSLLLGAVLPVGIFVLLAMILVTPLLPTCWWFWEPLKELGTEWNIIVLVCVVLVSSFVLYALNAPLIRVYEGYPWKSSWIGRWFTSGFKKEFNSLTARKQGMRQLLRYMRKNGEGNSPSYNSILASWNNTERLLHTEFPRSEQTIFPTRLGNIIRSFEDYPRRQYGMDSVVLWPRLVAVADTSFVAGVSDARTSFNFMVNGSALSTLMAAAITFFGLFYAIPLSSVRSTVVWALQIIAFLMLARLCYVGAISRAKWWGAMFRSMFDVYRWDLLKQLGYNVMPATQTEEQQLWTKISQQMIYGFDPESRPTEYAPAPTSVHGIPSTAKLEVTRGVSNVKPYWSATIEIKVCVKNVDAMIVVRRVSITDTVPNDFDYVWNSARAGAHSVSVTGVNPHDFTVEGLHLAPDDQVTLTYSAVARKGWEK
jgi:hypothetical protein